MPARNAVGLPAKAVIAGALLLALAGCVSATPGSYTPSADYVPALPGYSPQQRLAVAPRAIYPPPYAPAPYAAPKPAGEGGYRPQTAAVDIPAAVDPPVPDETAPLVPVEPVGRHRVDPSCTDYWDWCHFF